MFGICPWCSLEKVVKAVAIYEIVMSFACMVISGVYDLEYLRGPFPPFSEAASSADSLLIAEITAFLIFFFVLLINLAFYYWGAKQKKEVICWVWLGLTMTIITISVASEIYKFLGVEIGPIGGNRKDASAALLIYTLAQYLEIWVVLRFVMQLRHQRKAHQLEFSVGVANGAGVGKIRQEPLVKAADYGNYEQPHTFPVYQPTSTISTV